MRKWRAHRLDPALAESDVTRFVIDSREADAECLGTLATGVQNNGFHGDFADSTESVPASLAAGAAAAVVRDDRFTEHFGALDGEKQRLIFSDDVIASLQALAHQVYLEWDRPVVAITGSAGKTTAKELTAHVLSSAGLRVLRNKKNYNNGLGHPDGLELARRLVPDGGSYGASTPLNDPLPDNPPDVVVLNVLPVHRAFGTTEIRRRRRFVEGMKDGGTAVQM